MDITFQGAIAVIVGFISMVVMVMAGEWLIGRMLPESTTASGSPSGMYLGLNLSAGALAAVVGGCVAGLLAPAAPLTHAIALAAFVLVMGIISALLAGDTQPRWYQAVLTLIMPLIVVGGGLGYVNLLGVG